jgi:Tfp pilus assembly protein PilN
MIKINLLEKKSKFEILFSYFNFFILEIFIFMLALIGTFSVIFFINKNLNVENAIISEELDVLDGFLRPLQKRNVEIIKSYKEIDNILSKIHRVLDIKNGVPTYYKMLSELEKLTPDDCWISNLTYNGKNHSIQLNVNALRTSSVNMFVNNLTMDDLFSNIRLQRVSAQSQNEFEVKAFIIFLNIKGRV